LSICGDKMVLSPQKTFLVKTQIFMIFRDLFLYEKKMLFSVCNF
jgi:hypothetical protein